MYSNSDDLPYAIPKIHNEYSVSREEVYLDRGSLTWWLTNPSDEISDFCIQYLLKLKWLTNK